MLSLDKLKSAKGASKKRKRIGRGNASGHGTYSTRGLKGQKSRSGVTGLKRLGMKQLLMNIPKKRGFKSAKSSNQVVNLVEINKYFKDGSQVNPKTLNNFGMIDDVSLPVKILGKGELKVKGLEFFGVKASASAKKQIEKLKGKLK